jgi:hypothetical protein
VNVPAVAAPVAALPEIPGAAARAAGARRRRVAEAAARRRKELLEDTKDSV